ncbi:MULTISPECIES: VOC family protein [Microbacterium]|uniref:VOC family protein n=1 Tax=Microbacterium TaxID=33882 RepID=UPI00217DD6B9|nr:MULTISPECIES: VOC family protein [Microbacterium]UWF78048.1 VOC family protein [Microbacterium neungamense]WCM56226.1 VOC family protein [Microbacterium sp. EF45047]
MEDTRTTGVTGQHTTDGRPNSATSLTPFLAIPDAAGAIAFYRDVFGARVVDVTEFGGSIAHADLDFGLGRLQLGEPSPQYRLVPPPAGEDDCYSIGLYVPDVDAVVERAIAAGAVVREAPSAFVSGDRYASIRDPFGVRWSIMTRVEDLSDEESARRVAEWAASFAEAPGS